MFSTFRTWRTIPPRAASEPTVPPGRLCRAQNLVGRVLPSQPLLWMLLVDKNLLPLSQGSFCLQQSWQGGYSTWAWVLRRIPRAHGRWHVQAHGEVGAAPAKLREQP